MDDFHTDIALDVDEWSDTSNYSPSNLRPLPMGRNKKVVKKMKNEVGGRIITDFTALRSKPYAYRMHDRFQGKKCNGIKCYVMNCKEFERRLLKGEQIYKDQLLFRSINHRMSAINQRKLGLSIEDDKRVLCPNYISTLAKRHYRIGWNSRLREVVLAE